MGCRISCSALLGGALGADKEEKRATEVLGGPGHFLQSPLVHDVLVARKSCEAGVGDLAKVVVDCVALGSQSVLNSVSLEVGFDSGERYFWMECGEDQTPASAQSSEGLSEEVPHLTKMFRNQSG